MKHLYRFVCLSALLVTACDDASTSPESSSDAPGASTVAERSAPAHTATLELFAMSQCPYGVEVENALVPVKEQLGDALDLSIDYIGGGTPGALTSMHGPDEVTGDIAQLCAARQMPGSSLDFVACQNDNPRAVATSWESCARQLGLDGDALSECISGDEGQKLLAASFDQAARRHATGSPTLFLNGQPYAGGRRSNDFLRAICATYGEDAPQACADIPPPVKVEAIFLSDTRCAECDLHPVEPKLRGVLPGVQPRYVDYGTEEGQAIYAAAREAEPDFVMLPAVLLDPSVEKDPDAYRSLARYLRPVGPYVELRMGGQFDPTAEICDNEIDDDDNGSVDCGDPACDGAMVCREAIARQMDLFIMSHCPYGARAILATHDALQAFGDDMTVKVHFIGGERDGQLSSMHGQAEVDDDVREICAAEHFPDQFMAFDACISRDYKNADWKACASEARISAATIDSCFEGEGPDLLRASFAEAARLGIGSSPTYMMNNQRIFRAASASDIQREFCRDNPGLDGCGAAIAISGAEAAPVPAGECGG